MAVKAEKNFSFAKHTAYGCGGIASVAYYPENQAEACEIFDRISSGKFCILGNGSNVLAQDSYYNGCVLSTKHLTKIKILDSGNIYCDSGVTVAALLNTCKKQGLSGLEYLAGIPATMGGVCCMNAGAANRYIADNIVSVTIYDGKKRIFSNKECNFGYKQSTMRGIKCLILGCELKVCPESGQQVAENVKHYLNRRKCLPKGKSCGCVFKNPEGISAGALIESAGLKAKSIGCAKVSEKHANFIIAEGSCSQDVYKLIAYVKKEVYNKFAIELEEEVCYIGDFE